jgi:WD40 repeat protein
VFAMGGQGKTALVARFAREYAPRFAYVLWLSLRNAPPLAELLSDAVAFFGDYQDLKRERSVSRDMATLLRLFAERRCLLVLDNLEAILQEGAQAGTYRQGYEQYGNLLSSVAQAEHRSCLLITSREKPGELVRLEGAFARSLSLVGLSTSEGRTLLQPSGLQGDTVAWQTLIDRYSGNPLALSIMVEYVREIFGGQIERFLAAEQLFLGDIRHLLEQQFVRLTALEQEVLYWLALMREPVGLEALRGVMLRPASLGDLVEAVGSLRRRSLVERTEQGFTLQNVLMEFVTERIVTALSRELAEHSLALLQRYPLMQAQAREYIREIQLRLILDPLLQRLIDLLGRNGAGERLRSTLAAARQQLVGQPAYAGGNLCNLLAHFHGELRGYDFSGLALWQADLRRTLAHQVRLHGCDLSRTVFREPFGSLCALARSPDGTLLAIGTYTGEIRLCRASDGALVGICQGHTSIIWTLAFSPDGRTLASGSYDHAVRLWSVETYACIAHWQHHNEYVRTVLFSPDGRLLITASEDQTIQVWEIASATRLHLIQGQIWWSEAALSPDGRTLACASYDRKIHLWDLYEQRWVGWLEGHTDVIWGLAFSPDGHTLASCANDLTIRLWDINDQICRQVLYGHSAGVSRIVFNPAGTLLASGGDEGILRLWDVQRGQCLRAYLGHRDWVMGLVFSADEQELVSGSRDQSIRFWEVASGRCLRVVEGYTNIIWSVAFHPNGRWLAATHTDEGVQIWDVTTHKVVRTLKGHRMSVFSLAYSPDGRWLASGSGDATIRVWNTSTWECERILTGHQIDVYTLAFSPDSQLLASMSADYLLNLWEIPSGQVRNRWQICTNTSSDEIAIAFHPAGHTIAASEVDGIVATVDLATNTVAVTISEHDGSVRTLAYSPDGRWLASGDGTYEVWLTNAATGETVHRIRAHNEWVMGLAFSPDSTLLASSGGDRLIYLWDVATMERRATLHGHTDMIRSIAFSPDGQILASGGYDETLRLWDVQSGECIALLRAEPPYAGLELHGATGLSAAQRAGLVALGAVAE